jgi:serine/threonine-protein kinase
MRGVLIGDKYELLGRLGHGGMGEVFLARQRGPSGFVHTVVVKRLRPDLAGNREYLEMFLEEARLTARLVHPSIVQLYELFELNGEYFIAMEYGTATSARRTSCSGAMAR